MREDLAGGPARALERLATVPVYCCCEQVLTADQTLLQLPVPIRQRNWLVTHLQLGKFSPDQLFGHVTPRGEMAPNSAWPSITSSSLGRLSLSRCSDRTRHRLGMAHGDIVGSQNEMLIPDGSERTNVCRKSCESRRRHPKL